MGDLILKGGTSGQITVTPTAVAGTNTLTLPAKTGNIITSADSGTVTQTMLGTNVAGNGPAFSAYQGSNQSIANNTFTKLQINTEDFDVPSPGYYDNTTNYRFTPTVAGYYLVCASIRYGTAASGSGMCSVWKTNSEFKRVVNALSSTVSQSVSLLSLVYLGSTDYIELYAYQDSGGSINALNTYTYFQSSLLRAA